MALVVLGLSQALATYLDAWAERSRVVVDFFSTGIDEPRLPSVIEITLYRIVQEASNNVVRHAAARNVSVSIERRKDHVVGIIEDDGKGFDFDTVRAPALGRLGIAECRNAPRSSMVSSRSTLVWAARLFASSYRSQRREALIQRRTNLSEWQSGSGLHGS